MRAAAAVVAAAEVLELPALGRRDTTTSPAFGQRSAAVARATASGWSRMAGSPSSAMRRTPVEPELGAVPARDGRVVLAEEDDLGRRLAVEALASVRAAGAPDPVR